MAVAGMYGGALVWTWATSSSGRAEPVVALIVTGVGLLPIPVLLFPPEAVRFRRRRAAEPADRDDEGGGGPP
jgi:hypothetical protein